MVYLLFVGGVNVASFQGAYATYAEAAAAGLPVVPKTIVAISSDPDLHLSAVYYVPAAGL